MPSRQKRATCPICKQTVPVRHQTAMPHTTSIGTNCPYSGQTLGVTTK